MRKVSITLLGVVLFSCFAFSQKIAGEIFTKSAALEKFGAVTETIQMSTTSFTAMFDKSTDYMMFKMKGGSIYIMDNKRRSIYPENVVFSASEVLRVLSISRLRELIEKGREPVMKFELRGSLFTISNGEYTLDISWPCPPDCF